MLISAAAFSAVSSAIASRGKYKGMLKAAPPAWHTLGYAAWQAAMVACNPRKASLFCLSIMSKEQRKIYREVEEYFANNRTLLRSICRRETRDLL